MGVTGSLLALGIDTAGAQSDRGDRYFREDRYREDRYRDDRYRDDRYRDDRYRDDRYRDDTYNSRRRVTEKPVLAIVALNDQRITIYGVNGKLLEAPVSTGSTGYETPAGIFSVVQKKEDHRSNLYEDGEMPFMQRITWTGIALHAGNLPGHPASHGCVRLPMSFARQLFDLTELGLRVVIVREDMQPSPITHPALFKSKPLPKELALAGQRSAKLGGAVPGDIAVGSAKHLQILESLATAKAGELETAAQRHREARGAASKAAAEAAAAARLLRAAEGTSAQAERALKDAERRIETAGAPRAKEQAEAAKTKATARLEQVQAQLQAAKLKEQAKREVAERATAEADAAAAAKVEAVQAAEEAARKSLPVSVFVSRKTQRLYIRKGNYPIFEGPVAIRNAQTPIGTFVFTALEHAGGAGEMRWNVLAMYRDPTNIDPAPAEQPRRGKGRHADAAPSDTAAASAALDRITFTPEALDIITDVVLPGSSLIISDEGPSRETGKDTDFVVVMSNEPQGALKIRQREPLPPRDFFDKRGPSPFFWTW
jgi:L,D-transpeptidase-like protein